MEYHLVRICTNTWERLRDLQRVYDLDVFRQTAKRLANGSFEIQGLLYDKQIEDLSKEGYLIEVIADAEKVAKERVKEVSVPLSSPEDRLDQE
jgi:hypothetical protein